jgi:hypothetical protein
VVVAAALRACVAVANVLSAELFVGGARACVRECAGAIAMEVKRQAMALRASANRCDANLSLSVSLSVSLSSLQPDKSVNFMLLRFIGGTFALRFFNRRNLRTLRAVRDVPVGPASRRSCWRIRRRSRARSVNAVCAPRVAIFSH